MTDLPYDERIQVPRVLYDDIKQFRDSFIKNNPDLHGERVEPQDHVNAHDGPRPVWKEGYTVLRVPAPYYKSIKQQLNKLKRKYLRKKNQQKTKDQQQNKVPPKEVQKEKVDITQKTETKQPTIDELIDTISAPKYWTDYLIDYAERKERSARKLLLIFRDKVIPEFIDHPYDRDDFDQLRGDYMKELI